MSFRVSGAAGQRPRLGRLGVKEMPSRRKRKDRTARWKVRRQTLMQQRRARSHSPKALTTSPRRPPPALLYDFLRVAAEETEARSYLDKLENIASNALWTLHLTRHEALLLKLAEATSLPVTADGALALRLEEAKRRAGNEEAEFQDWCGILRNYYTDELVCMQLEEGRYRRGILTEVAASVTDLFYHYNFDRPACAIQRLWRGHRERKLLPERRREHRRREAQRLLEDERKAFAMLQERIEEREAAERAAVVEDELRLRRFIAGLKEDEAGPVRRRYAEWIEGRIEEILSSEEPFRQKIVLEERRQWASLSRYLWETLRDLVDYERNSLHADIMEYYCEREVARQEREGLRQWRLRRHAAALQLQAWVRGCWGRQAAWALRREAEEARWRKVEADIAAREAFVQAEFERHDRLRAEGERRYLASIQLQRVWRGYKGRGTLHAKKFRCKMHANRQEVAETALMAEADAHSLAAVEAYVMAVTKRWAPIFLAKKVLRERRHQLMMERRAFVVRDYYAGVAWAVALLQRQWRAALARRVVWWRRANGGEQQHVLRAQEVERKHLEWEERLKWETLQRVGHGLRCGDFTEDAAEFWAEVLEAERIQKSAEERQCRRHAAATVVQQFCRIRTSCAAVGRQHEALGRRRLAEFRAEEAARPVREREWRRLAASAVQRVFRGFQCRQALPYGVRELMVVTRAAEVQRRLDVDAEIVAWKSLLAMDERQRRHLRLAVVAEERRRWVSVLRVQRWYRRLRSAWRDRQLEQLLEELHLVDRSEALQRRSLQRSEDAQRRDLLSLFEETRPISLADSLQRSLDARRLRMELEKQSLFTAAPPSPAAGDASSEWTMSKWKFEKRPQVTADELAVAAARASTPPNFSVF